MTQIKVISCGHGNAYLLCGPDGAILIDTGMGKEREKVLNACGGTAVKLLLLTHGHCDHCQSARWLAERLGCPVGIGEADIPLLQAGEKRPVQGSGLWGRVYAAASNRVIQKETIPPVKPEVILKEGMSLAPFGVEGETVALPGHTKGSMGVWLESGALFVGDAMQNFGRPSAAWCYEDHGAMEESAAKIRRMNPAALYFGHGKPVLSERRG